MFTVRKIVALLALVALGVLIVSISPRDPLGEYDRVAVAMWLLLVPLGLTTVGFLLERPWSRWLALAAGIAVLPWALVLTFGLNYGAPLTRQTIALVAALTLLLTVTGKTMVGHYEGRDSTIDWTRPRMALVSWTIACNLASLLTLYVFVAAYQYRLEWLVAVPAVLLIGLAVGVLLLARQKTVGLLLVAFCCILFVPATALFISKEARYAGEALLFIGAFLPGVLTGWASLIVFGRPLWRYLRAG